MTLALMLKQRQAIPSVPRATLAMMEDALENYAGCNDWSKQMSSEMIACNVKAAKGEKRSVE